MTESPNSGKFSTWKRRLNSRLLSALLIGIIVLGAACNPKNKSVNGVPSENVSFESNAYAEFTGFTISLEYPRELQIGYFSDSGAYGWMIADADPQQVFWTSNASGNEITILMMFNEENEENASPSEILSQFGREVPAGADIMEFSEDGKEVAYFVNSEQLRAAVTFSQTVFVLFGEYPQEKEDLARRSLETILHSLEFHDARNQDFSNETIWGTRDEGLLISGKDENGYIPLSSASTWEFNLQKGREIALNIDTQTEDAELALDILDKDGKSVLASGEIKFTGRLENHKVTLPGNGIFTIKIYSPVGWYGWYTVQIQ